MAEDYYQLLGIGRSASGEEIKKAFRTKAHQFHPDKATGNADQFKKINEAYQVLSDPQKRQQYDQFGQTFDQARRQGGGSPGGDPFGGFGANGASGFSGNVDFGDLGDIFGDMFGFGGRRTTQPQRGRDIAAILRINFRTSISGGEETIDIQHPVRCDRCDGAGAEPGTKPQTCPTCQGSGQVRRVQQTILGAMQAVTECQTCQGQGTLIEKKCTQCHGQGRVNRKETVTVKIPAGIADGQRIKLSGKGEAGTRGVPSGDLYLQIEVKPDPIFKRQGDDIGVMADVPFSTAALGGTVPVPTLEDTAELKIPAGTSDGQILFLKGKGAAKLRGRGRGDLLVTVQITVPQKISAKARKLLKDLQDEGI